MNLPAGPGSAATSSARSFSASFATIGAATVAIVAGALLMALPALAYQYPLSSTDIRSAYLLGSRNDFVTTDFLAQYKHELPMPQSGPHVATISVETPYTQVIALGKIALNPDVQQAEQDFAEKKFPFILRVGVDLTDTYPGPPPWDPTAPGLPLPDFQRDFEIQLVQHDKVIESESTQVYLLTSDAVANIYQISGAIIELRFDVDKIDPYDEATVRVHTPDDQDVETTFDLGHLR
ncbi:MAG: hypothetical protein WAN72_25100 [Candidatus Acidiferrales bacterium]